MQTAWRDLEKDICSDITYLDIPSVWIADHVLFDNLGHRVPRAVPIYTSHNPDGAETMKFNII